MSSDDIIQNFGVQPNKGLNFKEVLKRRLTFGANRLAKSQIKSALKILIDQSKSILILLLFIVAGLSFFFDDRAEAIAIFVVIVINISIGFWAESNALSSMAALRKMGRATTKVRREGVLKSIPDEDIVPGDVVILEAGDVVTADIRLLENSNLQCDESLLTGESVPIDKSTDVIAKHTPIHSQSNMLFKGTIITKGSCLGITVSTGDKTELGNISTLTNTAISAISPLEKRLRNLSEQLLIAVLVITLLVIIAGIISGRDVILMVKTGMALAVAAIPEGLPLVATLALARGMWKLAKHNALIEQLSAVETLGSVNIIFTDKTGTLTENRMTALSLIVPDEPDKNSLSAHDETTQKALGVCALCYSGNDANHLSDPMEIALIKAAEKAGVYTAATEKRFPRIGEEAFDPNTRMMATIHKNNENFLYMVKGAPEAILNASSQIAHRKEDIILSHDKRVFWAEQIEKLAQNGVRVLALAEKTADNSNEPHDKNLTFLGLVGLSDPPRKDAAAAVSAAQDAGVRVIMTTGDNAVTSANIARAVGITSEVDEPVVEGGTLNFLENLSQDVRNKLLSTSIFARMSPTQKLNLIELHQQYGSVVAMTGDGVNDAPALKKADVGIAMGIRGTEVAKQAAKMILKDDAFASIIIAIQQGRIIYANIRKFVIYLLSCNLSEVLVVTLCMLAGLPLPLLPLQILFLNLVTDVFPALALGFGKGDEEILKRPPRPKSEEILMRRHWLAILYYSILMTLSVVGAFLWALAQPNHTADYPQTVAFLTLAFGQLWHVFNMRSRKEPLISNQVMKNPFVWAAILLSIILISIALYWNILANILQITPPDNKGWFVVIIASLLPLVFGQIVKSAYTR